ncbi:MAG: ATP-binding cassette domain-containing protein, partial [Candidatus Peregrinibacteria bacterium]|nr:ATP-binding cassette domain-containing protein [Candidatus Peregrinibacteria bacterium]
LPKIPPIEFKFPELEFQGAKLLETRNISFGYEDNSDLLKKVSFEIFPGEKIGIIGANGKGKSTLLNLLAGELKQQSGTIKIHPNLTIGFFGQSNINRLNKKKNIIEELSTVGEVNEQNIRSLAGNLLFSGDLAYKKIEVLSGGEKARVNLGKILLKPSNLLLLDEPTNHLDYESVEALIKSVKSFSNGVIFVSHNEEFLKKVAEKLIVFDNDKVYIFPGNYDNFLDKKGFSSESFKKDLVKGLKEKKQKPVHKEAEKEKKRLIRPLKRELERIEKKILKIESEQKKNKEQFDIAHRQGSRLKMDTLGIKYQELQNKLNTFWDKWSKIGEEIEKIVKLP